VNDSRSHRQLDPASHGLSVLTSPQQLSQLSVVIVRRTNKMALPTPDHPNSSTLISFVLGVVVCFFIYKKVIYPAHISPLASIPAAHWSAPYSRLWILWARFSRRENSTLRGAHDRIGSAVVRVAPWEVSVDGVEGVRGVYSGSASLRGEGRGGTGGWEKGGWYGVFDNFG